MNAFALSRPAASHAGSSHLHDVMSAGGSRGLPATRLHEPTTKSMANGCRVPGIRDTPYGSKWPIGPEYGGSSDAALAVA